MRKELATLRQRHRDLAAQVARGALSAMLAAQAEPPILADIAKAEAREQALITPNALAGMIKPGKDVAVRWAAATMSTKREIVRLLFSPDVLGYLRVLRAPRTSHQPGQPCLVQLRVQWWKPETDQTAE